MLAFAAQQGVERYLDPLLDAIQHLFPTARSLQVYVKEDPEIRDERCIIFDVEVPAQDIPDYVEAKQRWHRESFRICPAPLICNFCLLLVPVP